MHEEVGDAEKAATGFGKTVMVLVSVSWHPPKSLVSVTVYVPGAE